MKQHSNANAQKAFTVQIANLKTAKMIAQIEENVKKTDYVYAIKAFLVMIAIEVKIFFLI